MNKKLQQLHEQIDHARDRADTLQASLDALISQKGRVSGDAAEVAETFQKARVEALIAGTELNGTGVAAERRLAELGTEESEITVSIQDTRAAISNLATHIANLERERDDRQQALVDPQYSALVDSAGADTLQALATHIIALAKKNRVAIGGIDPRRALERLLSRARQNGEWDNILSTTLIDTQARIGQ